MQMHMFPSFLTGNSQIIFKHFVFIFQMSEGDDVVGQIWPETAADGRSVQRSETARFKHNQDNTTRTQTL